MEKIAFEVDEQVAKAWKLASVQRRNEIKNKIKAIITLEFFDNDKDAFFKYLAQRPSSTAKLTLTQKILDEIFKDELQNRR